MKMPCDSDTEVRGYKEELSTVDYEIMTLKYLQDHLGDKSAIYEYFSKRLKKYEKKKLRLEEVIQIQWDTCFENRKAEREQG